MDPEATRLRQRAAELRRLVAAIEASAVMQLERAMGDDTALGPRFEHLRERLRTCQLELYCRADELRWTAYRMDQRADELDADAARRLITTV